MSMHVGEDRRKDFNFQYRGIEGYVSEINSRNAFGGIEFTDGGYRFLMQYNSPLEQSMTEEESSEINEFALEIVHRLIDMKLDGDVIGK